MEIPAEMGSEMVRTRSVSWANDDCLVQILGELDEGSLEGPADHSAATWEAAAPSTGERDSTESVANDMKLRVQTCIRYSKGSVGSPQSSSKKRDRRKETRRFYSLNDLKALLEESPTDVTHNVPGSHLGEHKSGQPQAASAVSSDLPLAPCLEDGLNEAVVESPSLGPSAERCNSSPLNPQPSLEIPDDEQANGFIFGEMEFDDRGPDTEVAESIESKIEEAQNFSRRLCTRDTFPVRSPKGACSSSRPSARVSGGSAVGLSTGVGLGGKEGSSASGGLSQSLGSSGLLSELERRSQNEEALGSRSLLSGMMSISMPKADLSVWDKQWERLRTMIDDVIEPSSL